MERFEHFQQLVKMIMQTDPEEWDRFAVAAARFAAKPCPFEAGNLATTIMELDSIAATNTPGVTE